MFMEQISFLEHIRNSMFLNYDYFFFFFFFLILYKIYYDFLPFFFIEYFLVRIFYRFFRHNFLLWFMLLKSGVVGLGLVNRGGSSHRNLVGALDFIDYRGH